MNKSELKKFLKHQKFVKVNLGSGSDGQPDFINVDYTAYPNVDVVWDLEKFPWPFPSESVDLLIASQLVEHINPHGGIFIKFMDEAWRIMKPKGKFMIATPYGLSSAYAQDPTHCNPCTEMTWCYFDPFDPYGTKLYENYHPKPWKIVENSWYTNGNIETVLERRPYEKTYNIHQP